MGRQQIVVVRQGFRWRLALFLVAVGLLIWVSPADAAQAVRGGVDAVSTFCRAMVG